MLQSVNVGDVLVRQVGCTMVIYEFYKVLRTTKTQMVLMPMLKESYHDEKHDGFHPIVRPIDQGIDYADIVKRSKKAYEFSHYDPEHTYVEDHLD